ncbi:MAG TPA: SDR family NAD(P)-dependent oxidoreductase [Verrucomicrobiae bacterium]|jgi:NADP-dependent 3-hydroxy acid dehydrogenase YdfG
MAFSLAGKWVLITGASSGFGAAAASAFGALHCNLLLGARRLEKLETAAKAARQAGAPMSLFHILDVTKTASVEDFVQWARNKTSAVDVLINNAGGAHGLEPVATARDEDWEATLQTNVLGLLRVTRAVLPMMPKDAGSSILNLGSVAGRFAYEGGAAYCAAKAGELKITQALRLELNGTGIRIGSIDPGMARTEFGVVRFKGDQSRAEKVYEGVHPLVAEDVAEALVWAATRPPHVNIDEMVIKSVDQAATFKVFRRNQKA